MFALEVLRGAQATLTHSRLGPQPSGDRRLRKVFGEIFNLRLKLYPTCT